MSEHDDRRARIRAYKETARPMGVFVVRNTVSGKTLVGSSVDLPAMLNRQRFQLEMGGHPEKELQRDWNELGADAFEIETADTLTAAEEPGYDPVDDLKELEAMWADKLAQEGVPLYGRR